MTGNKFKSEAATAGCTHHKCKFCTLYNDLPFSFRMSTLADMEEDLREARAQLRLWNKHEIKRVFLVGANPGTASGFPVHSSPCS